MGGVIAYEVAYKLQTLGKAPQKLLLIDAHLAEHLESSTRKWEIDQIQEAYGLDQALTEIIEWQMKVLDKYRAKKAYRHNTWYLDAALDQHLAPNHNSAMKHRIWQQYIAPECLTFITKLENHQSILTNPDWVKEIGQY